MFNSMNQNKFITCCFSIFLICAVFQNKSVRAEEELIGAEEYRVSCLNCHGVGGKGDGPMSPLLTKKPSDLTILTKTKGGEYPFLMVYQTIDGRVVVPGHGEKEMPIWGTRYLEEDQARYGDFGNEDVVRARILELVYFIQQIQQK